MHLYTSLTWSQAGNDSCKNVEG